MKSNGIFCFVCKSTDDPLFGQGEQLEKDMFLRKGHIRHFFSKEYAQECLADNYTLIVLESGKENFYGDESGYIKVIARKIK